MQMDDKISTLPDEILCHILSFLPTKDAITTTLLSKRWKPIWLLVRELNFDGQRFERGKPYRHYVDMIYSIICAKSNLVVLKLKAIHVNYFIPVEFPSLKTLHLNGVDILEHWFLRELVNSCPILEDFEAKNISVKYWSKEKDGEFKSLTNLVRADISNLNSCYVPLEAFSNVQFLRVEEKIYDHVPVFPNLTHAELVFERNVDWCWVFGVLEKFPKLQNLVLEMPQLSSSVKSCILIPSISPECLYSQFKECTITNYRGQKYELQFAQYIMLNSTNLRRMIICSPSSMNDEEKLAMQMELLSFSKSFVPCQIYFN